MRKQEVLKRPKNPPVVRVRGKRPMSRTNTPRPDVVNATDKSAAARKVAAVRAFAAADARKAAADAVAVQVERQRHMHEVTLAEHKRLVKEHAAHDATAQRLAGEAEAQADAERAGLPWHLRTRG